MSDIPPVSASRAVFLSYASQDAEAALRLCAALRAAGVEVWFDQNELVGGDAWDAKIRKQIAECALFVPVISAATQARTEGYFRLEWKLAAQRTHMIADDAAFLLPVVIDETRDADARVPAEFKSVQWTRLPGGESAAKFCARVQTLLGSEGRDASPSRQPSDASEDPGRLRETSRSGKPARRGPAAAWAIAVVLIIEVALFFSLRPAKHAGAGTRPPTADMAAAPVPVVPTAQLSKAQQLVAQAQALFDQWDLASTDDMLLADRLLKQATELEPANAEAWAALAVTSYGLRDFGIDRTDARTDLLRTSAERAAKLAPDSALAQVALGLRYRLDPTTADDAIRVLRAVAAKWPANKYALWHLGGLYRNTGDYEQALAVLDRAVALPGGDPIALFRRAIVFQSMERYEQSQAALTDALTLRPDFLIAHLQRIHQLMYLQGNRELGKAAIGAVPPRVLRDEVVASRLAYTWYLAREPEKAADLLRFVTRDYIESDFIRAPKGLLAGLVHRLAGQVEAAEIQWRVALAVVEQRMVARPAESVEVLEKAMLLALLGERAAAEQALRLYEQLNRIPAGHARQETWAVYAELGRADSVADFFAEQLKASTVEEEGNGSGPMLLQRSKRAAPAFFRFEPCLDPFRALPRFQELAREFDRVLAIRSKSTAAPSSAPDKSVAVLAFKNLSGDPAREFFSDGLSEAVTDVLGRVPGLKVVGSASAFSFKGKSVPITEIARQLGVTHLVEGTVLQEGATVRITAKLIKADGFQVWGSDKLERESKNIFALYDEVAGLIAKNLSLKLGASSPASTAAVNPEAFELYLQARQAWNLRTPAGLDLAENLLTRALKLEAEFARAQAALADVWAQRLFRQRDAIGTDAQPNPAESSRIREKIAQALALDADSAEAHASLGMVLCRDGQNAGAESSLRRAVALNPSYASARQWLGQVLVNQAQMDEALRHKKIATELAPLSPITWAAYGFGLVHAGQTTAGLAACDSALALQPDFEAALRVKCNALVELGRFDDAIAVGKRLPSASALNADIRLFMLARAGMKTAAEELLRELNAKGSISRERPRSLLALGRTEEVFTHLVRTGLNLYRASDYLWDPAFDSVRGDPRWAKIMADAGLTEAHARAQAWRKAHPREKPVAKQVSEPN